MALGLLADARRNTAVEAAPWLMGSAEPDQPVGKLEPFKRRVAEDIRQDGDGS